MSKKKVETNTDGNLDHPLLRVVDSMMNCSRLTGKQPHKLMVMPPTLIFLILFLFVSTSGPAMSDQLYDHVTLSFNWPIGMKLRVENETEKVKRVQGEKEEIWTATGSYRMQTKDHEEGLFIEFLDFEIPNHALGIPDNQQDLDEITQYLSSFQPNFILSQNGQLLAIEKPEQFRLTINKLLGSDFETRMNENPRAQKLFDHILSNEYLYSNIKGGWDVLVGQWVDSKMILGATYEIKAEEEVPIFPGHPIEYISLISLVGRVPCQESENWERCIKLEIVSYPNEKDLDQMVRNTLDLAVEINKPSLNIMIDQIRFETRVTLVTEPQTLIPHFLEIWDTREGLGREGNDEPKSFHQRKIRRYRFYQDQNT